MLTTKQERIIRNSLKKTEAWWRQFHKKVEYDILHSEGYEDFLERTKEYTTENALNDMSEDIAKDVLNSVNFNKLERRALTRQTIHNNVANLVTSVGDDLKYEIRTMVKKGYDLGYHPNKIAPLVINRNLEALCIIPGYKTFTESEWNKLSPQEQLKYTMESGFKKMSPEQRSKIIARTEVSRTQNIVNYLEAQQDGANGFTVVCRPDCCEYCAKAYADIKGKDYDDLINSDRKQLIGGDIEFGMEETDKLPPFHPSPNCRCSAEFTYGKNSTTVVKTEDNNLIPEIIKGKLDNFYKDYGKYSNEHMQFFTEDTSSTITKGSYANVHISGEQRKYLKKETKNGKELHGTHTHPKDQENYTMLSHPDIVDVFMHWNGQEDVNLKSFSAENNRNRVSIVRLDNYNQYTRYNEQLGIKVDLRMEVNGVYGSIIDEYHKLRNGEEIGRKRLEYLREKRMALKEQGVPGYELSEKMEKYEKEADKLFSKTEYQKTVDNAYKDMIDKVNEVLTPYGVRFEVEYKN